MLFTSHFRRSSRATEAELADTSVSFGDWFKKQFTNVPAKKRALPSTTSERNVKRRPAAHILAIENGSLDCDDDDKDDDDDDPEDPQPTTPPTQIEAYRNKVNSAVSKMASISTKLTKYRHMIQKTTLSEATVKQLKIDESRADSLKKELAKVANARTPSLPDLKAKHKEFLKFVQDAKKLQQVARPYLRR